MFFRCFPLCWYDGLIFGVHDMTDDWRDGAATEVPEARTGTGGKYWKIYLRSLPPPSHSPYSAATDYIFCVRIDPTQFVSTVRTACTAQSHSSQQCKRRPFLANIRDGDKWYLWFYITDHVPLNIINYTIIDILLFLSSYSDCRRVGSSRLHHHDGMNCGNVKPT